MSLAERSVRGVVVPALFYGTAWKEERTEGLVCEALAAGFRAIDTANQRKHYHEAGVGQALQASYRDLALSREQLFLQSKFTFLRGQDHRLPYERDASSGQQVEQSFASSCEHLATDYLDSYVLHGPYMGQALAPQDVEVWRTMETLHRKKQVRLLGVSNITLPVLRALCEKATVPPAFVQNRCYASRGWDRSVRKFCDDNGVVYQAFSLLTANRKELAEPTVTTLAAQLECTVAQVVFRFALQLGMIPLTGTTSTAHMREDLATADVQLDEAQIRLLEQRWG